MKKDTKQGSGTHLVGYVRASYNELVAAFGRPHHIGYGDKTSVEWAFEDNGVRFTLYDYKWATSQSDLQETFHVGGDDGRALERVRLHLPMCDVSPL